MARNPCAAVFPNVGWSKAESVQYEDDTAAVPPIRSNATRTIAEPRFLALDLPADGGGKRSLRCASASARGMKANATTLVKYRVGSDKRNNAPNVPTASRNVFFAIRPIRR